MSDKGAAKANGTRNEQSVGGIAMLQMMQIVGKRRCCMIQRHRFQPWPIEKPLHPFIYGQVELYEALIHEHRDFPHTDRAQKYLPTFLPRSIDRLAGRLAQSFITAAQPQCDVRIEQEIRHRRISRPVSASIFSSSSGRVRSTPRFTFT
jgi:hypothetical protein